jgi:hypothetical protein
VATLLLRVPVDQAGTEFVEVEVDRRDVVGPVELVSDQAARDVAVAPYSLASSLDRVMPALTTIVDRFRTARLAPDEIAVNLGLKVGGETGLVFAKGSAEATFTATLTWRRPVPVEGEDIGQDGTAAPA